MPKPIESLAGFIKKVEAFGISGEGVLFFRGHEDTAFMPSPSLFRNKGHYRSERDLLYSIFSEHSREFESDRLTFDKLVRAQHYGVPTRLLDLSENALAGLYFAGENTLTSRGQVLIYKPMRSEIKYSMSDSVSCVSNLVHLSSKEKRKLVEEIDYWADRLFANYEHTNSSLIDFREVDVKEYEIFKSKVNKTKIFMRLVQFIREEKPYFENQIDPIDLLSNYFVYPKRNNPRIAAQSGAFVLFGLRRDQRTIVTKEPLSVADIKGSDKSRFLRSLQSLGIDESKVYPEMSRTAARIKKFFAKSQ